MDLTTGLLKSNEAISQADPVGKFTGGYNAGQDARSKATANEKSRWELDNQEKLQKAIAMSVDKDGNIVPAALIKHGHEMGIDQQVLSHAVEYLPKQWESIRKIAAEKNATKATNPQGAERIENALQGQGSEKGPGDQSWMEGIPEDNTSTQSSSTATATPPAKSWTTRQAGTPPRSPAQEVADQTAAPSGFATPSQDGATMDATQGMVGNAGLMQLPPPAEEAPQPKESNNIFQIANEMPAMATKTVTPQPVNSPVKIADLPAVVQKSIRTAMEQSGLLKAGASIEEVQAQIDTDVNQIMAKAVVPSTDQYIGADGQIDIGAYNKAVAEYPAKQAALLDEVKKKYGAYYGDQLSQNIAVEGNTRANVTQKTEQGKLASEAQAYEEIASNVNNQLGADFKPLSPLLLQKATPAELSTLTNGAKAYATLMELDAKCKAEKRNPTMAEIAGATNQMMQLDGMGANMGNEEKIQMLLNKGIITKAKALLLGNTPIQEMGEAIAKTYAAHKLGKDESIKDMAKATSYVQLHKQYEGDSKAFSGADWTKKKASVSTKNSPASATAKKPGETTAEYLKRIRGR